MNTKWKKFLRKCALLTVISFVIGFTAANIVTCCLNDHSITVGDTSSDRTSETKPDEN